MTAQLSDLFVYQDRKYDLAGISEGEIFTPESLGLHPIGHCTNCYRGYQAVFAVQDSRLVLKTLLASLYAADPNQYEPLVGPAINGVQPVPDKKDGQFNNVYKDICHPIPYSGGVLIARSFINELYEHMGFHPPWKYRTVWELLFEDGLLTKAADRSKLMAEARQRFLEKTPEESVNGDQVGALYAWIEQSFDRTY
jgi:hypothetical protein